MKPKKEIMDKTKNRVMACKAITSLLMIVLVLFGVGAFMGGSFGFFLPFCAVFWVYLLRIAALGRIYARGTYELMTADCDDETTAPSPTDPTTSDS